MAPGTWLILAQGSALGPTLADRLFELGEKVLMFAGTAVSAQRPEPFAAVLAEATATGSPLKGIVYIDARDAAAVAHVAETLPAGARLWTVGGITAQTPGATAVTFDLPAETDAIELAAMLLAEELFAGEPNSAVAYRPDGRYIRRNTLQR